MKNDENYKKNLSMWKISNKLDNVFAGNDHNYKEHEIRYYLDHYQNISDPEKIAIEVTKPLRVALEFRSATEIDDSKSRNDENEILSMLNKIGEDFEKLQTSKHRSNEIFMDASRYCKKSINERLDKLEQQNDKIYQIYKNNENKLKTFLNANNDVTLKKR